MKLKLMFMVAFFAIINSIYSQEIKSQKFGKGIFNIVGQDSSWTMKVGLRMQLLGTSVWEDGESAQTSFLVRRSRLKFDGFAFSPKLKYKIELGLSNRDMSGTSSFTSNSPRYIMDAVVKWNFAKNIELWAGQTKLPGNRERVISSGDLQLVDRSLVNSRFNIDRDIGLQLRHHFNLTNTFIVRDIFALSQGEGRNVTTGNLGGYQYTARLELLPFGEFSSKGDYAGGDLKRENAPKLAIGATYDFNNNAVRTRSNMGSYMATTEGFYETDISTVFIDAMFKYKGISFMAEYANRDAEDPLAKNADGSLTGDAVQIGNGLNLQGGYLFKSNWELSARYTNISLDEIVTGKNPENQYTFGVSKYIAGHKLKLQSDISYLDVAGGNNEIMCRLQFDIHF
ncbi:OprO/OprP family phosphate-selective porin [Flavobacteriaceae bacterium XHP0103]|uniref:porin n=1 Tax=Marixanthotalea marina TaxID=2844359 RepID=UPI002989F3EE|nr:porin [Marixanthotalea marina]MBU3822171.1 OprO/OprP family phosphate-selective porin [Marixanthotalea marina]